MLATGVLSVSSTQDPLEMPMAPEVPASSSSFQASGNPGGREASTRELRINLYLLIEIVRHKDTFARDLAYCVEHAS